jgi:hypothetical protein
MTRHTSGPETAGPPIDPTMRDPSGTSEQPTTQVARDEAAQVGRTGVEAGRNVVGTAAEQAGEVAHEARRQAKDMVEQVRGQATEQVRTGQQKAADGLRAFAAELNEMAGGGDRHGPASDLAAQAAGRIEAAADWLGRREPRDLLEEVRGFARRRPGTFLIGAALAGVLAGRLTRGAVDASRDTGGGGTAGYGTSGAEALPPPAPGPYPPGVPGAVPGGPPPYEPGVGGPGGGGQVAPGGPAYPPPPPAQHPGPGPVPAGPGVPGTASPPRSAPRHALDPQDTPAGGGYRPEDTWTDPGGRR